MPRKTPEEKERLRKQLQAAKPAFDAARADAEIQKTRWDREIAMLERRVYEEYTELDLAHGDIIALRCCLSETESNRLGELYRTWFSPMKKPDKNAIRSRKAIGYEIIALTTANPLITVEWLTEHPDQFSTDDAVNVILSWAENRHRRENERAARLISAITFRPDTPGPEPG